MVVAERCRSLAWMQGKAFGGDSGNATERLVRMALDSADI
jgi:hypothetical protein